jgi:hypothetical protein
VAALDEECVGGLGGEEGGGEEEEYKTHGGDYISFIFWG